MAKQLNLLAKERIVPTALHAEMQRSYLEYAMSVIVGRALPDVRDGLKPVHRRIIYAMHELGLTPDRPYRKCARVVGDVLGKYHPHGDQAVYDALVRLVQDFSTRYPVLDGHGNFGSVDNDPPAAMRYTETRLAPIAQEALLSEIGEATVDFIPNFDNSQQEPTVLPAQLPMLLLNGCSGIAVGMATNIPPHNLGEVVDGLIALIDKPDLSEDQLLQLIPGPDFPTGGEIVGKEGIREAYTTGKGGITLRGIAKVEEINRQAAKPKSRNRTAIIITELPYQVNKASWIEKIAELVNQGKIEGIADLRDESDREGMRVVVELRRDTNPQDVLAQLYKQTALSTTFGAIILALVDGQPRQLTLRQLLDQFLIFREQTLTKQYNYELGEAQRRIHIVEGLLTALTQLDTLINILRNAPDGSSAKIALQNQLQISESQSDAILAMPLRRLTGLERQNLQAEFQQLSDRIALLQRLLSDRHELLKALKKDLRALKKKYDNPRRTKLVGNEQPTAEKARGEVDKGKNPNPKSSNATQTKSVDPTLLFTSEVAEEEVVVEFTQRGYVRRLPKTDSKSNSLKAGEDFVIQSQLTTTKAELVTIVRNGKAYSLKVADIPPTTGRNKGTPLLTLLPNSAQSEHQGSPQQAIVTNIFFPKNQDTSLVLCTQQGKIKRLPLEEIANLTGRGVTIIKLKEDDELKYASLSNELEEVLLATSNGRVLRFTINEQQLPLMGRTAQGLQALRLGKKEYLVDCCVFKPKEKSFIISQLGYAKRFPVSVVRLANRGDIGTQLLQFTSKTDSLAGMVSASATEVIIVTSNQRTIRLPLDSVTVWGKDGTGDRVVELNPEEKVVGVLSSKFC